MVNALGTGLSPVIFIAEPPSPLFRPFLSADTICRHDVQNRTQQLYAVLRICLHSKGTGTGREDLIVKREAAINEVEFVGDRRGLAGVLVAAYPVDVAVGARFDVYLAGDILVLRFEN